MLIFRKSIIPNFRQCFCMVYAHQSYSSKVPKYPYKTIDTKKLPPVTKIDKETIEQLEKVSLVEFGNEKGIKIVEEAIRFADQISLVKTDGVEPLISVLEDRSLSLREDNVTDGNCKEDILMNAKLTEENYFIAPPGNIPLGPKEYDLKEVEKLKN